MKSMSRLTDIAFTRGGHIMILWVDAISFCMHIL